MIFFRFYGRLNVEDLAREHRAIAEHRYSEWASPKSLRKTELLRKINSLARYCAMKED